MSWAGYHAEKPSPHPPYNGGLTLSKTPLWATVLPLMNANTHPSHADNFESFLDLHREESDIFQNEYA